MADKAEVMARTQTPSPNMTEEVVKQPYNYVGKTKTYYGQGGTIKLPPRTFKGGDPVQMKVLTRLNDKEARNWKPFTIRGNGKYDKDIPSWTYQLNKNGQEYDNGRFFPELDLTKLKQEP